MPLAQDQVQAGTGQGQNFLPTWTMYEIMPIDGHKWFDGTDEERQATLPKIIPQPALQAYMRDGRPAKLPRLAGRAALEPGGMSLPQLSKTRCRPSR